MAADLTDSEIAPRLGELPGWRLERGALRKTYELTSFPAAIAFVTHVGLLAEAAGHHPDIDIRWRKVRLALSTHDSGGVTQKDFDLAMQIDAILG